jgi:hypothetical protein
MPGFSPGKVYRLLALPSRAGTRAGSVEYFV